MFSLPHNIVAYLYRTPIDMRYGMFRLQGVIARQLESDMPRGSFYFLSTGGTACSRPSGLTAPVCASFALFPRGQGADAGG